MYKKPYLFGKVPRLWKDGVAQSITFIVTEDCNLRCKYCYITHKSPNKVLSLNTAKEFINLIFEEIEQQDAVVLEFIGGEPLLEAKLIDEISNYFILKAYEIGSDWYWNYMINICTNGVNFDSEMVRDLVKKYRNNISIAITIDGIKEKHDMNRIFPDGSGSYDFIMKNVPIWLRDFVGSTKVTFASEDLIYLKDSIISLWNNGIKEVSANVVFEDVWHDGDDLVFEKQLMLLADYVLENEIYDKYYCTLFDENIGGYYDESDYYQTYCGAGKMIAVGSNGIIYPCIRYKDYSLNQKEERTVGNIKSGIDMEKVRPFMVASVKYQSDQECLNCAIAKGCAFCQGFNYDESKTSTNFYRAKYICKMHKARVRANDYYFSKLYNMYDIEKDVVQNQKEEKIMYILESNHYVSFCEHSHKLEGEEIFNKLMEECLKYARESFAIPILVHSNTVFNPYNKGALLNYRIRHILPYRFYEDSIDAGLKDCIYVFDSDDLMNIQIDILLEKCILNISQKELKLLSDKVIRLFSITDEIKLNVVELNNMFDQYIYECEINKIRNYLMNNKNKKIDILSNLADEKFHRGCKAGDRAFTISPEGNIYVCPAFYDQNKDNSIGSISTQEINFDDSHLYRIQYKPLCQICDVYTCSKCCYLSKSKTGEINVPPSYLCVKSHIEKRCALKLYEEMGISYYVDKNVNYLDPIEEWLLKNDMKTTGFYKITRR